MRFRTLIASIVFGLPTFAFAEATERSKLPEVYPVIQGDVMAPIFSDYIQIASIVARVHLTGRTPVNLQPEPGLWWRPTVGEGHGPSCGYLYHAIVVESIKGSRESFDFFSDVDTDFIGYDRDYIVIVFKRDENTKLLNLSDTKFTIPEEESKRINCLLSQKYYVASNMQMMLSFDKSDASNEEWLLAPTRVFPGSCLFFSESTKLYTRIRWRTLRGELMALRSKDTVSHC